ncbi:MAG: fatty acid desaturase CarF family protein [Myxococcota bacterium]
MHHPAYRVAGVVFWVALPLVALNALVQLERSGWLVLLISLPFLWALIDLFTGTVHWALDTFGTEDTPLIGDTIFRFRLHHTHPKEILNDDFLANTGRAAVPAVLYFGLILLISLWSPVLAAMMTFFAFGGVATNYIHKLAHQASPPAWAVQLQRCGLFLSAEAHDVHHSGDHRSSYCITSGWMNPLLDRYKVFDRLEATIRNRIG